MTKTPSCKNLENVIIMLGKVKNVGYGNQKCGRGGGWRRLSERTEDRTGPLMSGGRFSGPREGMTPLFAWFLRHSVSECRTKGLSVAWREESSTTVPRQEPLQNKNKMSIDLQIKVYSQREGATKYKEMSSILGDQQRPRILAQMRGEGRGGRVAGTQPMSTAVHRSPNKLGRSYSILYLWPSQSQNNFIKFSKYLSIQASRIILKICTVQHQLFLCFFGPYTRKKGATGGGGGGGQKTFFF